jgi:LPXTG-motif cell wall-anchored protein
VEVGREPADTPPVEPPDLADTGASLLGLLVLGAALTAAGGWLRRKAHRAAQGGTA